jgi:hypothetical protein
MYFIKNMNKKIASEIVIGIILLITLIFSRIFYFQNNRVKIYNNNNGIIKTNSNDKELNSILIGNIIKKIYNNKYEKITTNIEGLEIGYNSGSVILEDFDVTPNNKDFNLKKYFIAILDKASNSWKVVYCGEEMVGKKDIFSYEKLASLNQLLNDQNSERYKLNDFVIQEDGDSFLKIIVTMEDITNKKNPYSSKQVFVNYQNGSWNIVFVGEKIPCSKFMKLNFPEKFKSYSYCGVQTELTSNWEIVSGDPNDTCSRPSYSGEATINAWYVYDYDYVEKRWLIKISKNDLKNIFKDQTAATYNPTFSLIDMDKELEERLKNSSESNPVKLTIRSLYFYCEGSVRASLNPVKDEQIN